MTSSIKFYSESISPQVRKKKTLKKWICQVIANENKNTGPISIVLCDDQYLHSMNVKYLDHDTYTDIITFDYSENDMVSGDLFISFERVKENAKKAKTTVPNELHRVIIHGVLHLCGYKDKQDEDQKLMTKMENKSLNKLEALIA